MDGPSQHVPRIVVGVDGSPGSLAALRWALDDAERRRATVDVVLAWSGTSVLAASPYVGVYLDPAQERNEAKQALDDAVASGLGPDHQSFEVNRILADGNPGESLVEAARGADLLVVGSRGRGGVVGLLLGSVSQHCVRHASCPVVVVPC